MDEVITRAELMRIIPKFLSDENRGISIDLFAELAGVDKKSIRNVFVTRETRMTEYIQRRISKAYKAVLRGEIAVMQNRDQTRYVSWRRDPKPRMKRETRITFENGAPRLKIGIVNRLDYSQPDILTRK